VKTLLPWLHATEHLRSSRLELPLLLADATAVFCYPRVHFIQSHMQQQQVSHKAVICLSHICWLQLSGAQVISSTPCTSRCVPCMPACLSVCLPVRLPACPSACLPIRLPAAHAALQTPLPRPFKFLWLSLCKGMCKTTRSAPRHCTTAQCLLAAAARQGEGQHSALGTACWKIVEVACGCAARQSCKLAASLLKAG
jgi:hypothetical protein